MSRQAINKRDIFIGKNELIHEFTSADTAKHDLDLGFLDSSIVSIELAALKILGTGDLAVYPIHGVSGLNLGDAPSKGGKTVAIINNTLQYKATASGAQWQIICVGYTKQLSMMQRDIR